MVLRALLPALLIAVTSSALADPIEDYSFWRTAGSIDDLCHSLKWVERDAINTLASEAIDKTGQRAHLLDGRMDQEDYNAWADGLDAAADAKAAEIGCTAAAEPYLRAARGGASDRIYQDLVLAFHFHGLPADDMNRIELAPDQIAAAGAYDGFLQQVFGANFEAFVAAQRPLAAARLPAAAMGPQVDEYGFPILDYGFSMMTEADYDKLWAASSAARFMIEKVHFEVSAETNNLFVRPRWVEKYWRAATLNKAPTGELWATVFDGPKAYRLDTGEDVFGVFVQMPDDALRLMTYGANATDKLTRTGVARLFIRSEPAPADVSDYAIFDLPDFRQMAFPFDGVPVDEPCLGGPCWEFSPQTLEALYQTAPSEYAELWLSADPEAAPSATIDPGTAYLRGRVTQWLLWKLNGKPDPAPVGTAN